MTVRILQGDALEQLRTLADESVHSIVTDPPYGIRFMGKAWDGADIERRYQEANLDPVRRQRTGYAAAAGKYDRRLAAMLAFQQFSEQWAIESLRVLKPGGHLLCFASARTYHRMVCGIESAGFDIRDQIMWVFGSGFPKSHNLTDEWQGWGTALKPAHEPIVVARKPLIGTVAANVLAHGTGALNIDGCRVPSETRPVMVRTETIVAASSMSGVSSGATSNGETMMLGRWPANLIHDGSDEVLAGFPDSDGQCGAVGPQYGSKDSVNVFGDYGPRDQFNPRGDSGSAARFFKECKWESESSAPPASNVGNQSGSCETPTAAEHAEQPIRQGQESLHFQDSTSESRSYTQTLSHAPAEQWGSTDTTQTTAIPCGLNGSAPPVIDGNINSARREAVAGASGLESATRFWYSPKASRDDRNIGCDDLEARFAPTMGNGIGGKEHDPDTATPKHNHHPTVKPTDLMQYLVRLVTPPGGTVLDPFAGSGSTGLAADREGFDAILIEREAEYVEIARRRIVGDCPLFAELAA